MWSKFRVLLGVGVTVGTGLGIVHMKREVAYAQAVPSYQSPTWVRPTDCPYTTWDENWDRRGALKKPPKSGGDGKDHVDPGKSSKACRHLILIRHGQYNLMGKEDKERMLTPLGREQAKGVGERLKQLNMPYSALINSTMTRARETSNIISEVLGNKVPRKEQRMLEEGSPAMPEPRSSNYQKSEHTVFRDGARIEAAFRELFYRPEPSMKEDSYEIVVCHANVIRYFVCRALQFPPEAWLRFSLKHCSITWFTIHGNGNISVRSVGDSGFLPPTRLTTS
uniref:Serine/threonine-protein phosphatase PGAM5, mitochondrial n=1 Tax=Lygus hesperus TaxID=30085 RepID=A0A0A9Y1W7_LYGHE